MPWVTSGLIHEISEGTINASQCVPDPDEVQHLRVDVTADLHAVTSDNKREFSVFILIFHIVVVKKNKVIIIIIKNKRNLTGAVFLITLLSVSVFLCCFVS